MLIVFVFVVVHVMDTQYLLILVICMMTRSFILRDLINIESLPIEVCLCIFIIELLLSSCVVQIDLWGIIVCLEMARGEFRHLKYRPFVAQDAGGRPTRFVLLVYPLERLVLFIFRVKLFQSR
jgi:hypothetical protein